MYNSAPDHILKKLDAAASESLRVATGAFKSTLIASLQVIATEKPLQLTRDELTLKYYFEMRSYLKNPNHRAAVTSHVERLCSNRALVPPFALRAKQLLPQYEVERRHVKPAFSYRILNINEPTYSIHSPEINLELSIFSKKSTPNIAYLSAFNEIVDRDYRQYEQIFTDGAKYSNGVGAAAVWRDIIKCKPLPIEASMFTAEIFAVKMALDIADENPSSKFVIFSDSYSVLSKILNIQVNDHVTRQIHHQIYSDQGRTECTLLLGSRALQHRWQ